MPIDRRSFLRISPAALFGLDAMFPAAFLALLVPQLRQPGTRTAALCGAVVAVALVPFVPAGAPLLAATIGVVPGLRALHRHARAAPA